MEITYSPTKNRKNLARHGVSLALAKDLEWDLLLATEDNREAYLEQRMAGFAPIGSTVFHVCFTEEEDRYHIISLRKAEPKEVREYASQI
jgi:hypothetical protein